MKHLFAILLRRKDAGSKDYNKIILGKCIDNQYGIYTFNVNKSINIKYYYKLLAENDFLPSDFKKIPLENLINIIKDHKEEILHYEFSDKNFDFENKFMEIIKNI